jgi:phenylacetate-CoA ligase
MFNVRGINVFPTAVQAIIAGNSDLTSGHFRIVLEGPGPYDRVCIRAEAAQGLAPEAWPGAARALEKKLRDAIGASAVVELLPFETLERTGGKTSIIERIR